MQKGISFKSKRQHKVVPESKVLPTLYEKGANSYRLYQMNVIVFILLTPAAS